MGLVFARPEAHRWLVALAFFPLTALFLALTRVECPNCGTAIWDRIGTYCKHCGVRLRRF